MEVEKNIGLHYTDYPKAALRVSVVMVELLITILSKRERKGKISSHC